MSMFVFFRKKSLRVKLGGGGDRGRKPGKWLTPELSGARSRRRRKKREKKRIEGRGALLLPEGGKAYQVYRGKREGGRKKNTKLTRVASTKMKNMPILARIGRKGER